MFLFISTPNREERIYSTVPAFFPPLAPPGAIQLKALAPPTGFSERGMVFSTTGGLLVSSELTLLLSHLIGVLSVGFFLRISGGGSYAAELRGVEVGLIGAVIDEMDLEDGLRTFMERPLRAAS